MTVFTDEQARQQFDRLLTEARETGEVRIRSRDGHEYLVRPAPTGKSPLDVPGVATDVTADEIVTAIREVRERG